MTDSAMADGVIVKHEGDAQSYALDFTLPLNGRTLTAVSSSVVTPSGELAVSEVAVNAGTYVDDDTGSTVAIGKAVQFNASGGDAWQTYVVTFTCTTSDSKTIVGCLTFKVVGCA